MKKLFFFLAMAGIVVSAEAQHMPYTGSAIDAPTENSIVRTDRQWKYHAGYNGNMNPSNDIYLNLKFSGSSEVDGKEYSNCYVWKDSEEFSEQSALLLAYMREENGKVFVRFTDDLTAKAEEKGIDIIPYSPVLSLLDPNFNRILGTEILLFDQSIKQGDFLYSYGENSADTQRFYTESVYQTECLGQQFNVWHFSNAYSFIDGVGDETGLLPLPNSISPVLNSDPWYLVELRDLTTDTVIYDPQKAMASVANNMDSSNVLRTVYHSIDGRPLNEPSSKGIYIKTTEYENGRISTEKIVFNP